jgi:glucose-6-phosphate dehydrogenase assembly protein OpcA
LAPRLTVDPAAIERELSALWMAEAEARQRHGLPKPLSRTLLHSLIVVTRDRAGSDLACQVATALNPRQPGRTIMVEATEADPEDRLEAWVSLQCTVPRDGHEQVCGEQISLEARGPAAVRRLPGAVLPLLLTDVPAFMWWQSGRPFGQSLLKDLAPALDRLIVDSFTFAQTAQGIREIQQAIADPHFAAIVSDLSWARLAPWRYLTAQIFDAAPVRPYLARLREVEIQSYAGPPVLAWLYAGWLASRLGWTLVQRDGDSLVTQQGSVIRFETVPSVGEVLPGYFTGVRLVADGGATFEVCRLGPGHTVTRQDIGELHTERVVPLRQESLTEWLGHELARLGPVPTYDAAVRLLATAL